VVECTGLENRQGFIALLGFKSLSLRHIQRKSLIRNDKAFLFLAKEGDLNPGFLFIRASYPSDKSNAKADRNDKAFLLGGR
jgi:hypothetical protein